MQQIIDLEAKNRVVGTNWKKINEWLGQLYTKEGKLYK